MDRVSDERWKKIAFRAMRESVGLSRSELAGMLGMKRKAAIKRWESPGQIDDVPSPRAWEALTALKQKQDDRIVRVLEALEGGNRPKTWRLVYWCSPEHWRAYHPGDDDVLSWKMENATNQALSAVLDFYHIRVAWTDDPYEQDG